jgi:hypothetical protein
VFHSTWYLGPVSSDQRSCTLLGGAVGVGVTYPPESPRQDSGVAGGFFGRRDCCRSHKTKREVGQAGATNHSCKLSAVADGLGSSEGPHPHPQPLGVNGGPDPCACAHAFPFRRRDPSICCEHDGLCPAAAYATGHTTYTHFVFLLCLYCNMFSPFLHRFSLAIHPHYTFTCCSKS